MGSMYMKQKFCGNKFIVTSQWYSYEINEKWIKNIDGEMRIKNGGHNIDGVAFIQNM